MNQSKATTILFVLLALAGSAKAQILLPPPQAAGYSLSFSDDFTTLNLSPTASTGQYRWYRGIWWEAIPKPFQATAFASVLDLTWSKGQTPSDTTISSCSSNALSCNAFRYGYFEARMKWDVATGAWPGFWLLAMQNIQRATESGELDVFEGQGDPANSHTYYGTIHDWQKINGVPTDVANNGGKNWAVIPGVNFSQWHTYGVLWVPGTVTWYFDNEPVLTAPTYPIFDQQMLYIMLGAQEGSYWQGGSLKNVTANNLNLYVDWVRVWQQPEQETTVPAPVASLLNQSHLPASTAGTR